jgi:hypothetical protein
MNRVYVGFVVCALGLPAFLAVGGRFDAGAVAVASMVANVTTLATLLTALPFYRWCRARQRLDLGAFFAGGAAAGALCAVPVARIVGNWGAVPYFVAWFLPIGALHATAFWFVAIWRNRALHLPSVSPDTNEVKP